VNVGSHNQGKMAAQWEGEMVLGCSGSLQVAYYRDNRLGSVDHEGLAKAVATLPQAFDEGASGKRIFLKVTFPLIIVGFIVTVIGASLAFHKSSGSSSSSENCPDMGDPGWYDCKTSAMESNHESSNISMAMGFVVTAILMIAWFASSVCLFCLRSQAIQDGFHGVQRQLGKLNESMSPLNFCMRTEMTAVRERRIGHIGEHGPGTHRTRIIYRYFLEIRNTAAQAVVTAVVVGDSSV